MKNNLWYKKFIESEDVHDLYRKFALLTRVHLIFLK
jgi:hypothetical protein